MSETAPERPAPSGGNVLTRKIGPLPTWGWLALAIAGGVGYIWWRNRSSANSAGSAADQAAAAQAADTSGGVDTSTDDAASIATLQSEIQQLQGQASTEPADVDTAGGGGGGVSRPSERTRTIIVEQRQTLAQLARRRGWPARRLKAAEALNGLSAGSELRRGQKIKLPA